jgi:phenylalanyl-tRNA synthetase alpha chain
MTALIPPLLREQPRNVLLVCPGVVYRRDCIDRWHCAEPHQVDLWHLGEALNLERMIERVMAAALPGHRWRTTQTEHPYTTEGRQIDVLHHGGWIEVGECGLSRLCPGLAMGLGLDRLLMLRKGLDDIRLLRSKDPRVQAQLLDLSPYRPVSRMPAVTRDLSIVVPADTTAELLGDRVRGCDRDGVIEEVSIVAETPHELLPARLCTRPGEKNVLLRLVMRAMDRSLTRTECNALRDEVAAALAILTVSASNRQQR